MACTATATPKVAEEIVARLGLREPARVRSGFDRPNLSFDVLPFDGEGSVARKRATLLAGLSMEENRPAVVYCGTRKSTEEVAELLSGEGLRVVGYHAGMPAATRSQRQDAFMSGAADVVVATNAFGMGVDKADVRSVWHWALPSSLEAYYQEAGRAGRDGKPARAVLLASRSDLGRLVRFIREAEVTVEQVGAIVGRLRARDSGEGAIELHPDDDRDRIALAVAERAGALTLRARRGRPRARAARRAATSTTAARASSAARRPTAAGSPTARSSATPPATSAAGAGSCSTTSATTRRARRPAAAATSTTRPTGCRRSPSPPSAGRPPSSRTARRSPTPSSRR